jgi:putative metallohydrolase (TIGR04338 family)
MRDVGRKKLYDAEDASQLIQWGREFNSLEECQRYVNNILRSKWFKKRYPKIKKIDVRPYRGEGAQSSGRIISLSQSAMNSPYLLHEIAHHAATIPVGHGWEFAEALLCLVRRFLGKQAFRALRTNFRESGVKYFSPRGKYERK